MVVEVGLECNEKTLTDVHIYWPVSRHKRAVGDSQADAVDWLKFFATVRFERDAKARERSARSPLPLPLPLLSPPHIAPSRASSSLLTTTIYAPGSTRTLESPPIDCRVENAIIIANASANPTTTPQIPPPPSALRTAVSSRQINSLLVSPKRDFLRPSLCALPLLLFHVFPV